jgi:hypothetical protein
MSESLVSPDHSQRIPDMAPVIVCDIRLGKKYTAVEFDYDTFAWQAHALGMTAGEASQVQINLDKKVGIFTHGEFDPDLNTVHLKSLTRLNRVTRHELQHAADHAHNRLQSPTRTRLGNMAMSAILPATIFSYATSVAAEKHVIETGAFVDAISYGTLGFSVLAVGAYHLNPDELRARRAEKSSNRQFFTLSKKPGLMRRLAHLST